MIDSYEQLFQRLPSVEPPPRLQGRILARLALARQRLARVRMAFSAIAATALLTSLAPAFRFAAQEFSQSGFHEYLSLAFSDMGLAMTYWQEFALSLAESLPWLGMTITLSATFAILWTARSIAQNARVAFTPAHLI